MNVGDRTTNWLKGISFVISKVGKSRSGSKFFLDPLGNRHRLEDCQAPDDRYEQTLNDGELSALVKAVTTDLDGLAFGLGTADDLLGWVGLLSPVQKRQLWDALTPEYRAEFVALRQEVA